MWDNRRKNNLSAEIKLIINEAYSKASMFKGASVWVSSKGQEMLQKFILSRLSIKT